MIRLAREEDLKAVNKIRRAVSILHSKARQDIFKQGWQEKAQMEYLKTFLTDENLLLYVCEIDGKILGYAMVEKKDKPASVYSKRRKWFEVHDFGVDEQHRGQRVGTQMFEFLKKEAKAKGFPRIELTAWDFNKCAIHFYEKNGFGTSTRRMEIDL